MARDHVGFSYRLEANLNYQYCYIVGLPVAKPVGIFAVKQEGLWMHTGIILENLKVEEGWHTLPSNDDLRIQEVINMFAERRIFNGDIHFENVMVNDSTGELKIVDLDRVSFSYSLDGDMKERMTSHVKWISSLEEKLKNR